MNSARKTRVLIVNLGTPEEATPESVRAFLEEFLTDPLVIDWPGWLWRPILNRFVLRSRPQRVAALYESIWTPDGSPLAAGTRRIAEAVGVAARGAFEVGWAFRYGPRSIDRAFRELLPTCDKLAVIPLFPQRTGSTSGSIRREAESVARRYDAGARMRLAALEPDDPDYVRALADRYRQAMRSHSWAPQHLLISFHGIPTRYDRREGRIYTADCARTCVALLRELDWDPSRTTLCYQSKFGPEPWLVPATADRLQSLPGEGVQRIAVISPGFITEGLETLEEIAIQGKESFLEAGGEEFAYVPAVEDHPALIEALVRVSTTGF